MKAMMQQMNLPWEARNFWNCLPNLLVFMFYLVYMSNYCCMCMKRNNALYQTYKRPDSIHILMHMACSFQLTKSQNVYKIKETLAIIHYECLFFGCVFFIPSCSFKWFRSMNCIQYRSSKNICIPLLLGWSQTKYNFQSAYFSFLSSWVI